MHRPGGGRAAVCDNEGGLERDRVLGGGWTQQWRAPSLFSSATGRRSGETSEDGSSQSSSRRCRRRNSRANTSFRAIQVTQERRLSRQPDGNSLAWSANAATWTTGLSCPRVAHEYDLGGEVQDEHGSGKD